MTANATKVKNTGPELPELPVGSRLRPDTAVRIPKGAVVRTNDPARPAGSYTTTRPQIVEAEIVELDGLGRVARWKARGGHYVGESPEFEALTDARLAEATDRLAAIREMHQPRRKSGGESPKVWCRECQQDWPCPTYTAAGLPGS